MLHVRRYPGQRTVVFDRDSEVWVTVSSVSLDTYNVGLVLENQDTEEIEHVTLSTARGHSCMQGDCRLTLLGINEMDPGPHEAVIGFDAPASIRIRREETLMGSRRADRRRMIA